MPLTVGFIVLLMPVLWGTAPSALVSGAPATRPEAQDAARIELVPQSVSLRCNETEELAVTVSGARDLWGVDLQLVFDPALVEAIDGDARAAGVQLSGERFARSDAMVALNAVDAEGGVASYAAVLLRPAQSISAEVEIARLVLRGRAGGRGEVSLRAASLADPQARPISATLGHAVIEVDCAVDLDVAASVMEAYADDRRVPAPTLEIAASSAATDAPSEDDEARMMLYLLIGMLAAVSAGVAGIAGGIVVARRMQPEDSPSSEQADGETEDREAVGEDAG